MEKYKVCVNYNTGSVSLVEVQCNSLPEGYEYSGISLTSKQKIAFTKAYCAECKRYHFWFKKGRATVPPEIWAYFKLIELRGCTAALKTWANPFFGYLVKKRNYEKFIELSDSIDLKVFDRIGSDMDAMRWVGTTIDLTKTAGKVVSLLAKTL